MSDTIARELSASKAAGAPAPAGLVSRAAGVLTSPRSTYTAIAARPQWLGILLAVTFVAAAASAIFLSTEVGRQALLDQQIRTLQSFGNQVTDAQYRQFERMAPFAAYLGAAGQAIGLPLVTLGVAAIAFAIFGAAVGGGATFKQVFAVAAHSTVILGLRALFVTPLNYARDTMASPTSFAAFAPFLDDATFVARLLGSLDLFYLWWLLSFSIGLAVVYRRKARWVFLVVVAVYAAVALALVAAGSALSGTS
jgi:hypothetical protein